MRDKLRFPSLVDTAKNYWTVISYCQEFPQPWWKLPWVCYTVYKVRRELGMVSKDAGMIRILKGINSYGHWLRCCANTTAVYGVYNTVEDYLEDCRRPTMRDNQAEKLKLTCEVCNVNEAVGVACMPGVPCSVAYCRDCLIANSHPMSLLIANTVCCNGLENTADWWKEMVTDSLKHQGKTLEWFNEKVNEVMGAHHE